jgi:hypothetical protein
MPYFVEANNFVDGDANNFVDACILSAPMFCRRRYFVGANILSQPIFFILFRLRMIICSNGRVLCLS